MATGPTTPSSSTISTRTQSSTRTCASTDSRHDASSASSIPGKRNVTGTGERSCSRRATLEEREHGRRVEPTREAHEAGRPAKRLQHATSRAARTSSRSGRAQPAAHARPDRARAPTQPRAVSAPTRRDRPSRVDAHELAVRRDVVGRLLVVEPGVRNASPSTTPTTTSRGSPSEARHRCRITARSRQVAGSRSSTIRTPRADASGRGGTGGRRSLVAGAAELVSGRAHRPQSPHDASQLVVGEPAREAHPHASSRPSRPSSATNASTSRVATSSCTSNSARSRATSCVRVAPPRGPARDRRCRVGAHVLERAVVEGDDLAVALDPVEPVAADPEAAHAGPLRSLEPLEVVGDGLARRAERSTRPRQLVPPRLATVREQRLPQAAGEPDGRLPGRQ